MLNYVFPIEDSRKYTMALRRRMSECVTLPLHKSEWPLIGDTAARYQMNAGDTHYREEREKETEINNI